MTQPIQIRPASLTDGPMIYDFLCELENCQLDRPAFDTVFAHNLSSPTVYYYVARQATDVVGFISCHVQYLLHHTGPVGEIQELYVRPSHRNRQIGRHLLTALETALIPLKLVNLEVTTNRLRADAIRFYESLAFQPTHLKLVRSCPV